MTLPSSTLDWAGWMRRWDAHLMQYWPDREKQFQIMVDTLDVLMPQPFVALDLACGPGSLSQRVLTQFPTAHVIAVDYDPVLLHLGRSTFGTHNDHLHWHHVDILDESFPDLIRAQLRQFNRTHLDAVLTISSLHYLPGPDLIHVYQRLGDLTRPGGVLLNCDDLAFPLSHPTAQRLAATVKERRYQQVFEQAGGENYRQWWQAFEHDLVHHDPALRALFDQHHANEQQRSRDFNEPGVMLHEAALYEAGFGEVSTIWQTFDSRMLLAVRDKPNS